MGILFEMNMKGGAFLFFLLIVSYMGLAQVNKYYRSFDEAFKYSSSVYIIEMYGEEIKDLPEHIGKLRNLRMPLLRCLLFQKLQKRVIISEDGLTAEPSAMVRRKLNP